MDHAWPPWLALVLLGAFHGLNPAMGWLFAVARGLQEKQRVAVLQSLLPIALGHAASVALVVAMVSVAALIVTEQALRAAGAAVLILFGVYKFVKARSHPRGIGMRVGLRELAVWSFLMSTAHGAGLMLLPVMLSLPTVTGMGGGVVARGVAAVFVHTASMLVTMGIVALVVYDKLGLAILRVAWVNLDAVWAFTIVVAGVFTLLA